MKKEISENNLALLSGFIADKMGMHFPPARWAELDRTIRQAAAEFNYTDPAAFIKWLPGATLDASHMEILASHLTINETYFWRETGVFEALTNSILPELIRQRENCGKRLRIWSAACSSGEESYSIAIALHRIIPRLREWDITVLATDIDVRTLRKARDGIYGEWSFRGVPGWLKEQYFSRRQDGKYELDPGIKKLVTFEYLNLAQDIYPSPVNNTNAMDLIFCRNVLMYFIPDLARKVGRSLYASLVPGGYAVVGACELSQALFPQFCPVTFPGDAIVYKKGLRETIPPQDKGSVFEFSPAASPPAALPVFIPAQCVKTDEISAPIPVVPTVASARKELAPENPPFISAVASARELANKGNLTEALALCKQTLMKDKLDPVLHYLHALILLELHRDGEAAASIKKTLYLDPDLIIAHFTLGKIQLRQGNPETAQKSLQNALALLKTLKDSDILPESDGLTAGRFREIVEHTMQQEAPV